MTLTARHYYLGFNLVPGIGPSRLLALVQQCGSVESAWHASTHDMAQAGMPAKTAAALLHARQTMDLAAALAQVEQFGVQVVTLEDGDYPALLREAPDAPPLLYVRGAFGLEDAWSVAVVGTRSPTSYGKEVTRMLVSELVRAGVTIVSGLALGIDIVAHTAALEAGGRTLAVLGSGLAHIYPAQHQTIARQIAAQGALISDYPLQTRPHAANFPPRNRIISGLSRGVVVVEAGERSGALITVEFALAQGRDVFAVPGSLFNRSSIGTHRLIRNGAELVTCADDILTALDLTRASAQQQATALLPTSGLEARLLTLLTAEPTHVDALCRAAQCSVDEVVSTLVLLELKGYVRTVGSMEYVSVQG